jgi:hypothetical protein
VRGNPGHRRVPDPLLIGGCPESAEVVQPPVGLSKDVRQAARSTVKPGRAGITNSADAFAQSQALIDWLEDASAATRADHEKPAYAPGTRGWVDRDVRCQLTTSANPG